MANRQRLTERISDFRNALARLKDALARTEDEFIRDAIIQRFEFTYELAWKTMKLWLEFKDIDVRNPKDSLRESLQQGLIDDGNTWSDLHEMRNLTSHTYDEKAAQKIIFILRSSGIEAFSALETKLLEVDKAL